MDYLSAKQIALLTKEGLSRELMLLRRQAQGNMVDRRSPMFRRWDRNYARDLVQKELDSQPSRFLRTKESVAQESKEFKLYNNNSALLPYAGFPRTPLTQSYFYRYECRHYNRSSLEKATEYLAKLLPFRSLRPITIDESYRRSDKSTNWASPFFLSGEVGGPFYFQLACELLNTINKSALDGRRAIMKFWCTLTSRTVASETYKPKQRTAFMFSHVVTIIEKMFCDPLIAVFKFKDEFAMLDSLNRARQVITRMFSIRAKHKKKYSVYSLISIDFKSYDSSIGAFLIVRVFGCFCKWFCEPSGRVLHCLYQFFISSDLKTPAGIYKGRQGGVPSGSVFTNFVDSCVQLIVFAYVCYEINGNLDDCYATVMGDDGVWLIPNATPQMVALIVGQLGLTVHPDKCDFSSTYCVFCKRVFSIEYRDANGIIYGVRSAHRTMASAINMERAVSGVSKKMLPIYHSVRFIVQLEEIKDHPAYSRMVQLFMMGDPLMLGARLGSPLKLFKDISITEVFEKFKDRWRLSNYVRLEDNYTKLTTINVIISIMRHKRLFSRLLKWNDEFGQHDLPSVAQRF